MVRIRLIATVLQVLGQVAIVAGVWLLVGFAAALIVAGVEALVVGVAVERSVAPPERAGDI